MNDEYEHRAFWQKKEKFSLRSVINSMEQKQENKYSEFVKILSEKDKAINFNDIWFNVGDMVVIEPVCEMPESIAIREPHIIYVRSEYEEAHVIGLIQLGFFKAREATLDEKELCFFWYENMGSPIIELSLLKAYKNGKA